MQSEIIDEILAVEDEADKIVQEAQAEARRMVSEAHEKAARLVSDAVGQARTDGQARLEAAEGRMRKAVEAYERDRLSTEKAESLIPQEVIDRASVRIVDRICSIGD